MAPQLERAGVLAIIPSHIGNRLAVLLGVGQPFRVHEVPLNDPADGELGGGRDSSQLEVQDLLGKLRVTVNDEEGEVAAELGPCRLLRAPMALLETFMRVHAITGQMAVGQVLLELQAISLRQVLKAEYVVIVVGEVLVIELFQGSLGFSKGFSSCLIFLHRDAIIPLQLLLDVQLQVEIPKLLHSLAVQPPTTYPPRRTPQPQVFSQVFSVQIVDRGLRHVVEVGEARGVLLLLLRSNLFGLCIANAGGSTLHGGVGGGARGINIAAHHIIGFTKIELSPDLHE